MGQTSKKIKLLSNSGYDRIYAGTSPVFHCKTRKKAEVKYLQTLVTTLAPTHNKTLLPYFAVLIDIDHKVLSKGCAPYNAGIIMSFTKVF